MGRSSVVAPCAGSAVKAPTRHSPASTPIGLNMRCPRSPFSLACPPPLQSGVANAQFLDSVDPARAQPAGFGDLGDVRHVVGDRVEDQVDLQPGQVRANAVVRAGATEPQMWVGVSGDVEALW